MIIGAGEWRRRDSKEDWEVIKVQVLKHLLGAGKGKRECSQGNGWRGTVKKGGVSESLRERRLEEICQSHTSSP